MTQNQWQPIETAPKDKEILLFGRWLSGNIEVRQGKFLATRWPFVGQGQPTQWMLLDTDKAT
ncbi:hypothetical protein DB2_75 [Octadecabacter Antarctic DB virus 2]|nr:hypothetical protein DB2_75 [Octadecabacter Antarctic DB virus 2]